MREEEYIETIANLIPEEGELPLEAIALIDAAVQEHPESARLWARRGDLLQIGPEETPHPLGEALVSYHRALELAPRNTDVIEEIAHFHDAVMDDEHEAQKWFERAETMRKDNNPLECSD